MGTAEMVSWMAGAALTAMAFGLVAVLFYNLGRRHREPPKIIPVARKVDNRVVSNYSRAERRAHKRRQR